MSEPELAIRDVKRRWSAQLLDHDGVVAVLVDRGRLTVIVEDKRACRSLPAEIEGYKLHFKIGGRAVEHGWVAS
jgi:hypothetical protein